MTSTNWAGNLTYGAAELLEPRTLDEVQEVVSRSTAVRALGSRHSFNRIADTTATQVSVAGLPRDIRIDAASRTVDVSAGARYGEFVEELDLAGWAIHNLASLPHISVAGAIATGTHGSGDRNVSLAGVVAGLEIVTATGDLLTVRRGDLHPDPDPDFDGMVVSLGALGIVTRVTLDIVPAFEVRQTVFENLPWSNLEQNLDAIMASAYSVSLFTHWGEEGASIAWLKSRADDPAHERREFFGAAGATRHKHPLPGIDPENTSTQLGVPGRWWDRLPHFRLGFTPSDGVELQSEFLVPRQHALAAIDAVRALAPRIRPHLFVSELRTIAADALWLSPSHSVDCLGIHFTWRQHLPEVSALLRELDAALAPFEARPHWGKLFETDAPRLAALYPRLPDFRALAARLDPERKFGNDFLEQWVYA